MFQNLFGGASRALAYEEVTPQQVEHKRKSDKPTLIIDVREPYEYREGHIPGSKLIPLGQLTQRLNELGSKEQEVILVCRSGSRSGQAARKLSALGYKKVLNLRGGMLSWLRAGLAAER
jgi:rhodanese-related sulfurtransferase